MEKSHINFFEFGKNMEKLSKTIQMEFGTNIQEGNKKECIDSDKIKKLIYTANPTGGNDFWERMYNNVSWYTNALNSNPTNSKDKGASTMNTIDTPDEYRFTTSSEHLVDFHDIAQDCSRDNPIIRVRTHGYSTPLVNAVLLHSSIIRKAEFIAEDFPLAITGAPDAWRQSVLLVEVENDQEAKQMIAWAKKVIAAPVRKGVPEAVISVKFIR